MVKVLESSNPILVAKKKKKYWGNYWSFVSFFLCTELGASHKIDKCSVAEAMVPAPKYSLTTKGSKDADILWNV